MGHFVVVHKLADCSALSVARLGEAVAIGEGEVEIRLLESEPDCREEGARTRGRCGDGGELAPEIVGMVPGFEASTLGFEAVEIEAAVSLFIGQRRQEAAPKCSRQLGPAQQSPREELDRLQFMMGKPCQAVDAVLGLSELPRPGQAVAPAVHAETWIAGGTIDLEGGPRRGVREGPAVGIDRRSELRLEIARFENLATKLPHPRGGRQVRGGRVERVAFHAISRVDHPDSPAARLRPELSNEWFESEVKRVSIRSNGR